MMEREKSNRSRRITLRLTEHEYEKIENRFKASTCRKLSDHIRRHLFNKPIETTYRNASFDDHIQETIALTNEINSIGNNINQMAKKMNSLRMISELKELISLFEIDKQKLFEKMKEIQAHTQKISEQWLQ